ncbi:MAG TPA: response regulator [Jatrophihabitans sp.]|jgi:response regulator of citrate/malate metabolism
MTAVPLSVLVVDDDYRVSAVHAGFAERVPGYQVAGEAHTAAEAVELARSLRPDLVLLDLYLPDGNGLDVALTLLGEPEPPAIIVISAARDLAAVQAAMQLGAVSYLVKPFGFDALAERLAAYRRLRARLSGLQGGDPTQAEVDQLFGMLRAAGSTHQRPSAPTLERVRTAVAESDADLSAAEVAQAIGISRATAQRYLTDLVQSGELKLELRYGTGRPEHRYRLNRRS